MFEFFLRKTILRSLSEEDLYHAMLLKDKIKMKLIAHFLVYLFGVLPLASFLSFLIASEHTLSNIIQSLILIFAYCAFLMWFLKRFGKQITVFQELISASLYSSRYVIKGNAISEKDFNIIKEEDKKLHYLMMTQQVQGYCYSVCFTLLKCLKKGTIQFVAVKCLEDEKEENDNLDYTMHVLYVNDGWCFDTYSERQFPLDEVIKRLYAKTYTSFNYEAVEGKTYEEFRAEHAEALKVWCQENGCYQKWLKD